MDKDLKILIVRKFLFEVSNKFFPSNFNLSLLIYKRNITISSLPTSYVAKKKRVTFCLKREMGIDVLPYPVQEEDSSQGAQLHVFRPLT